MSATTQKAMGIQMLHHAIEFFRGGFSRLETAVYKANQLVDSESSIAELVVERHRAQYGPSVMFVRPCPVRPRHGFVDSQAVSVNSYKESTAKLKAIAEAALSADPDSEIAISQFLKAECNAILTNTGVTLGPGNDGATSGRNSITIPIKTDLDKLIKYKTHQFGVGAAEGAYLEFVDSDAPENPFGYSPPYITQVRAGPKVEASDDYIPRRTKVGQIITITPDQNLLDWEQDTQKYANVRNLVVYHEGGSINSHFGVHCVINQVPYITSFQPKLGSIIDKTAQTEWQDDDFAYIAELVKRYDQLDHRTLFDSSRAKYARFVLSGLHAIGNLMQSRSEYAFRAAAAALVTGARLFNTVATGELRHVNGNVTPDTPAYLFFDHARLRKYALNGLSNRDTLYSDAMGDHSFMVTAANRVLGSYYNYSQPEWHSGYGGYTWAECAKGSFLFSQKLAFFVLEPNRKNLQDVLNEFNALVNLVHNNGWWLNKVLGADELERCSKYPAVAFVSNTTYKLLTGVNDESKQGDAYYEDLLKRAQANEQEYRGIIEALPNYIAGAEVSGSGPFNYGVQPLSQVPVNLKTAFTTPMIIHATGYATFPEFRTKSARRARYSLIANFYNLMGGIRSMAGHNFEKIKATLILDSANNWMGVAIPNHGQPWLVKAAQKYPHQFKKAWDKQSNSFVWIGYSGYPFRYLGLIAKGEAPHWGSLRVTYHPLPESEKNEYQHGKLTLKEITQGHEKQPPKGFKLLPPFLTSGEPTPNKLEYLHKAYVSYKMTGAYDAEES